MSDIAEYFRGDTKPFKLTVTVASGDISGWTFTMSVDSRKNPDDGSTQVFQLAGVIVDAPNGLVEFRPSVANTDLVGTYYYDMEANDGTYIRTVEKGKITFTQDITK